MPQNALLHRQICTSQTNKQPVAYTKGTYSFIWNLSSVYTVYDCESYLWWNCSFLFYYGVQCIKY